jgi:hypothetical protein
MELGPQVGQKLGVKQIGTVNKFQMDALWLFSGLWVKSNLESSWEWGRFSAVTPVKTRRFSCKLSRLKNT